MLTRPDFSTSVLLVLVCVPELIIWAADAGWFGSPLWRSLSVQNGAFWPGLLRDWVPNFAAQPWTMFLTYSALHIGIVHMLGNAFAVAWLGPQVVALLGHRGLWVIWIATAFAGGASFAMLSSGTTPMVGASGSVFGLLGAVVQCRYLQQRNFKTAGAIVLVLVVLHLITLFVQKESVAWQPHLGGFLIGIWLAWWGSGVNRSRVPADTGRN